MRRSHSQHVPSPDRTRNPAPRQVSVLVRAASNSVPVPPGYCHVVLRQLEARRRADDKSPRIYLSTQNICCTAVINYDNFNRLTWPISLWRKCLLHIRYQVTEHFQSLIFHRWIFTETTFKMLVTEKDIVETHIKLTPSTPAVSNCCCLKGSAPYWSNPPFLIFDIRALWRSVLSARAPECQKIKMVG